jgi:hypothetical protein
MIAMVMGFFAVDEVVLKAKGIIRLDGCFVFGTAATKIVIDVGGMMVDHHDHSPDLMRLDRFPKDSGIS